MGVSGYETLVTHVTQKNAKLTKNFMFKIVKCASVQTELT